VEKKTDMIIDKNQAFSKQSTTGCSTQFKNSFISPSKKDDGFNVENRQVKKEVETFETMAPSTKRKLGSPDERNILKRDLQFYVNLVFFLFATKLNTLKLS
jgi:hypothetical protein